MRAKHLFAGVVLATFGLTACASTPDPPPPDLSAKEQEVEIRLRTLELSEENIEADLVQLAELARDVATMIERTAERELPLSLIRMVAMNCLNAEYEGYVSEVVELNGTPLSCRPAYLDRLAQALEDAPVSDRDTTYQLLYAVDQSRLMRGSLRRRSARLPDALAEHREFIADERAGLRRLEAELEQQRNRYSASGWQAATEAVRMQRELLLRLSLRLDELEESYPLWAPRLDETMKTVYFDLTELRRRSASLGDSYDDS